MGYTLFLDDIRVPEMVYRNPDDYNFVIVRTYKKFVAYVEANGLPKYISFHNDLGLNSDGEVVEDGYAGAKQIEGLLTNYINHLKSNS